MAVTVTATVTVGQGTSVTASFTDGFGTSKWIIVLDLASGASAVTGPTSTPTGTQAWTAGPLISSLHASWYLDGAQSPLQVGNILATFSWTGSVLYSLTVIKVDGAQQGLDVSVATNVGASTNIAVGSLSPGTGHGQDTLITVYSASGAFASTTITVPVSQTQAAQNTTSIAGPVVITTAVGYELLANGQTITGVTAANPMVLTMPDTTGVVDNSTYATWSGFGGADAAYLNSTNPNGLVTAHTATTLTIGGLSTAGKTLTTSSSTKMVFGVTPVSTPTTTGTRTATQTNAATAWGYNFAVRPLTEDSSGILLPAWSVPQTTIESTSNGSSAIQHKDIGFGSAASPTRGEVLAVNAGGLWTGVAGVWAGFSGAYKIAGAPSDITAGVSEASVPAVKRVLLTPRYHPNMVPVETYSLSDGSYQFLNLAPGIYDVWGWDQNQVKNGVVRHMVTALVMDPIL
jgi:hypothetical protein